LREEAVTRCAKAATAAASDDDACRQNVTIFGWLRTRVSSERYLFDVALSGNGNREGNGSLAGNWEPPFGLRYEQTTLF
jgi:hypothetical protein